MFRLKVHNLHVPVHTVTVHVHMYTVQYLCQYLHVCTSACSCMYLYNQYKFVYYCTSCIYTCFHPNVPVCVCVLESTDPARKEGAVLELAEVESDEISSRHEHE